MLERAPACLEQGGRRVLGKCPRQIRSKRALHSAFWTHGAGEIDLPSWWIALLQRPPPEASEKAQSIVDTAKRCLSAGLTDGGFLDFLYPAKTLTLIHKLAVRDGVYLHNRQKILRSPPARPYSNEASEVQLDESSHTTLAVESDQYHAESLISSIQQSSETTVAGGRVAQKELPRKDPTAATIRARRDHVRGIWMSITGSPDGSIRNLDANADEESLRRLFLLQQTSIKEHSYYLQNLLKELGPSLGIRYFSAKLKTEYHLNHFTAMLRLYEEALDRHQDHEATPSIMRLALDFENWTLAWRAYLLYKRTPQDEAYFWKELDNSDLTTLMEKSHRMSQYAIRRLKSSSDENSPDGLRDFAIKFIEKAFISRGANIAAAVSPRVSELVFDKLVWLLDSKSMIYDQYRSVIRRFLEYNPDSKVDLAESGFRAIRVYHQMRRSSPSYPEQDLVEDVLVRACKMHHCTTKDVYNDLKSLYGIPSSEILRAVLGELEYQTDVKGFYSVFHNACNEGVAEWNPDILLQLLRMFSNRREASQAQATFNSIRRLTGEHPNLLHWNALIAAYANEEDIINARNKLQSMTEHGINATAQTYEPFFKYFARRGDTTSLDTLAQTLEETGVRLQNFVFEAYVQAHIENQQMDEAEATLLKSLDLDIDGSRSRMWGQLAIAYARLRMKTELEALREKMQEYRIPEGDEICQATIISHIWDRRPFRALKVVIRTMPSMDIAAKPYHYALVMGGFISCGKPKLVPEIEQYMLNRGVAPDFSVKTLKVRAAGRRDASMYGDTWGVPSEDRVLKYGEAELSAALQSSDRSDLGRAHDHPVMGVNHATYDDAYAGNYFLQLLTMYGSGEAWKRAATVYDRYIAHSRSLAPNQPFDPPVKLISWLMGAFRHSQEFDEVARGWKLAVEKSAELAARDGADRSGPGWVLPARRYHLALPMVQYMLSLFDTRQLPAVEALVAEAHRMGFELESRNWNAYVQGHAAVGDPRQAFVAAERELMPGWQGWPDRNALRPRHLIGRLDWWQPREHETLRRMPTYKTMVLLARAYTRMQQQWLAEGRRKAGLTELLQVAPTAVEEVTLLPRMNDRFQRGFLLNV